MSSITLTFCECAENHVRNQQIGSACASGYSIDQMRKMRERLVSMGIKVETIRLHQPNLPKAYLLVARNALDKLVSDGDLFTEMMSLAWDSKVKSYGRVVNKHARHNLCFADFHQDPDYENGKGTIHDFADLPVLSQLRNSLQEIENTGDPLLAEGNYYYDVTKCGIGFHGDAERKRVMGVRLGETMPLVYQWYYRSQKIGDPVVVELHHGDLYIMSEKAVGNDWHKKVIPTLRHAAGCTKYTGL